MTVRVAPVLGRTPRWDEEKGLSTIAFVEEGGTCSGSTCSGGPVRGGCLGENTGSWRRQFRSDLGQEKLEGRGGGARRGSSEQGRRRAGAYRGSSMSTVAPVQHLFRAPGHPVVRSAPAMGWRASSPGSCSGGLIVATHQIEVMIPEDRRLVVEVPETVRSGPATLILVTASAG